MIRTPVLLLAALLASLTITACGSSGDTTKTVVTVIQQAAPTSDATGEATDASDSSAKRIAVPDVVGMDHQDAQDKMQDTGLYNLDEKDATGKGRLLLYDHNWQVVRQEPAAGTRVDPDTKILLISKKKGE